MTDLSGYHAALLTPFTHDGTAVQTDTLGLLVRRNIDMGLTGLYVGGSTGETFLMSADERKQVFSAVAEAAAGDCLLIAHVGDVNPAVSEDLADHAAATGYDAVSAVPPFYYSYSFAELRAHYGRLAGRTDLPFLVYNFPALSGVRMSAGQLTELTELPNVVGVKNTCGDHFAFEQLRRKAPGKTLLNGFDETLLAGLSLGADGAIGSTFNVQGDKVLSLAAAFAAGDLVTARGLQAEINGLIDVLIAHGVFPGLKYLLELQGVPMGMCRSPFQPLAPVAKAALETAAAQFLSGSPHSTEQRKTVGG
ncbi:MAG: N-acetylneuraminate lyase [Inquilinaceae bacterium]